MSPASSVGSLESVGVEAVSEPKADAESVKAAVREFLDDAIATAVNQVVEAAKTAPVLDDTASEASDDLELSAIFPEEDDDLNTSDLVAFGPQVAAIEAAEAKAFVPNTTPVQKLQLVEQFKIILQQHQNFLLRAMFHGNAKQASVVNRQEQARQLTIHADPKTIQKRDTILRKANKECAQEHLTQLIDALTILSQYEVSSMQTTLQDHVLALEALKIDNNTDLDNVKDRLKDVKVTLDKTSYGTLGGVHSEQTAFSVFLC